MRFAYFAVLSLLSSSLPCKAVSSREEDDIAMKSRHLKPKKETGGTKKAKGNKGKEKGVNEKAKENKGKEVKVEKGIKGKKSNSPSLVPSTLPSSVPSKVPTVAPTVDPIPAALAAFYDSTNGSDWVKDNNWGDLATPVCSLTGVTCTDGKITKLRLYNSGLNGSIPSEIGLLTSLTGLYLSTNQLTGPIPSEIGLLTSLTALNLIGNQLTGPIPPEIGLLTSLTFLVLSANALTGTLPLAFENLTFAPYLCRLGDQTGGDPLVDLDPPVKGNCIL